MMYIIVIVIVIVVFILIYTSIKGIADIKNVNKYGGLKLKYINLIELIMSRNPFYQIREINSNNIELLNTGIKFKFIEIDKKLHVYYYWNSFSSGKNYRLKWRFDEFKNQKEMYSIINKDVTILLFIDDGMTKQQAEDWFKIINSNNEIEKEKLLKEFSYKYPKLWIEITKLE